MHTAIRSPHRRAAEPVRQSTLAAHVPILPPTAHTAPRTAPAAAQNQVSTAGSTPCCRRSQTRGRAVSVARYSDTSILSVGQSVLVTGSPAAGKRLRWSMVASTYGLWLLGVAAGIGLWFLIWHDESGWWTSVSLTLLALLSIFVFVVFTTAIVRTIRQEREQAENGCPNR
jgi:hypothetical protein